MTTTRHPQPELEALSAYLDHQLPEAEEQALRSRLNQETALRQQLDDLRQTRHVLRHTPRVKRQRSFVLSPEVVRQQRSVFRLMNFSRLVSAVSAVLLLAVIGGQFLLGGGDIGQMASAPMENVAFSADEASEADMAEEPMMMQAVIEEEAMADDAAEAAPAAAFAEETTLAEVPTATAESGIGGGVPPAASGEDSLDTTGEPTPTVGIERSMPTNKEGGQPEDELDGQAPEATGENMLATPPMPEEPVREPVSTLQIVQGALLFLVVAGGLSAVFFRKKVR